jgi:phosphoribosylanthranilate isomerase
MTWIKVCGTTNLPDAQMSVSSGADALGFIFAPSPRRIGVALASEIVAALPNEVERIGVFVNQSPERVAEIAVQVGLTGVQLHGDEPPEQLPEFRGAVGSRRIIKALQARELLNASRDMVAKYLRSCDSIDAVLLDSGSPSQRGGTGDVFSWEEALPLAASIQEAFPLIIAGGLNSRNADEAVQLFHPWGLDVVSGVERAPGKKDGIKLRDFIEAVRREQPEVG